MGADSLSNRCTGRWNPANRARHTQGEHWPTTFVPIADIGLSASYGQRTTPITLVRTDATNGAGDARLEALRPHLAGQSHLRDHPPGRLARIPLDVQPNGLRPELWTNTSRTGTPTLTGNEGVVGTLGTVHGSIGG